MTAEATPKAADGGGPADAKSTPMPVANIFHQIVLWPIHLIAPGHESPVQTCAEVLAGAKDVWKELDDEFGAGSPMPQERHYREFVTFLPYVQRLLYGEGRAHGKSDAFTEPSIRTYRRSGVAQVRVLLESGVSTMLKVAHTDLLFFHDTDIAILAFEVSGCDLPLDVVQDLLYKFGRAYPSGWTAEGDGMSCPRRVELLDAAGNVLSVSDYEDRLRHVSQVGTSRAPSLASHWQFLLEPLVPYHSEKPGALRFRHLESHRMPVLTYLAVDNPAQFTRGDFARLAFATGPGDRSTLPYPSRYLRNFEDENCYDRYFDEGGRRDLSSRALFSGNVFVVVGDARRAVYTDGERGILSQFRHQFFLIGLIAHFQKAALLMMSERMVKAVGRLEVDKLESVRRFRRETRLSMELFLRFTHRYWVREVSDQPLAGDLFRKFSRHLDTDRMYAEARKELQDMVSYLDSDLLRRQSNTMLRLTVVTIIGLVGTTVTGFLGMNLIFAPDQPLLNKAAYFILVAAVFTLLTGYTLVKSRALADFLDVLSSEKLPYRSKLRSFMDVWRRAR